MKNKNSTKIYNNNIYSHSIVNTVSYFGKDISAAFVYIGDALGRSPQIRLSKDGSVNISSAYDTDEKTARIIRRVIKSAGGTVASKTWLAGDGSDTEVVKRKKDATRYTQKVCIHHGTTTINVTLFVDLA